MDRSRQHPCAIHFIYCCGALILIDMEEDYYDEEYYEGEPNDNCEKCGRTYDDIGYDYQYCKACGWDAENQKWDKPIKPTDADYLAGEADILTGRWW